jgi:autotransporter-associated beta strand protein
VQSGGSLTVNGPLTVNGNTVTAGTAFNGGGNGSAFGSGLFLDGSGTVTFSPASGQSQTVANVITDGAANGGSGSWGLAKTGAGTLTLSAANTYTGGTSITGGLINFNAASNFGPGTITLNGGGLQWAIGTTTDISSKLAAFGSGGATFDTNGNNVTLASALSGTGGLTKIGTGTLTVSGSGSYLGATNVNAGTLKAGATNAFSSASAYTIAAGATLDIADFDQTIGSLAGAGTVDDGDFTTHTLTTGGNSTSTTFTGTLSNGSGVLALVKTGSGTFTLSGVNTYTGGTSITGGLINFSAASNFGSGAITLNGGGLQWATGTTTDISSRLTAFGSGGATFDTNGNNVALASALSGAGGLSKIGAGTLTLSGANAYLGGTTINAGTLSVNGSIATSSGVTVNSGGTLAGTGTVGPTTIKSGGTFAPGNSPGTMTVAGNLAFQSGALYRVQVTPSTSSSANVSGTATLTGGGVQAAFVPGSYVQKSYDILHATGGLGGTTFGGVSGNVPAGFTESLSYSATDAFLNLTAVLGGPGALPGGGLPGNQQNVANALNTFFNNGGTLPPNFVTIFGLTGGNLSAALSQLSGEASSDAQQGAFQLMTEFLDLMLDPYVDGRNPAGGGGGAIGFAPESQASLPPDLALAYAAVLKAPPKPAPAFGQRWSAWGTGFGGYNQTNGDPAVAGTNNVTARTFGFAAGMDYHFSPDTVAGFALAGAGTNWGLANALGGGRSDAFQAGVYGITRAGPAYLAAAAAFANHWMTTNRLAPFGDQLSASFNAQSYGGRVEGGYRFGLPAFGVIGVTPYAAVQAQSFHTPSYSETDPAGLGFGLSYNAMNGTDTRSEFGARFDDLTLLGTMPLLLRARAAWAHDWVSNPALGAVFQALPGASFTVNGAAPPKDSALISGGPELSVAPNWSLAAKFYGEFASGAQTYAGTGTLRHT